MRTILEINACELDDILYKYIKENTIFDTMDTVQFLIKDGKVQKAIFEVYVEGDNEVSKKRDADK